MTNYPYVDIAVLEPIRRPFAAGDALVIITRALSAVVWANGSGLELFGLGRLDAALNGEAVLDDIQRRQIASILSGITTTGANSTDERMVHLRFVQGPQTILLPVHVSLMMLPDQFEAVLLRIPTMALAGRTQTGDTLEAIRYAGSHAAFIKPGARLISGADDLSALDIDPDDLARMMREVAGGNDRLVKRQLRTARGQMPAALARLTDDDGLHLLVVIDPESIETSTGENAAVEDAEVGAANGQDTNAALYEEHVVDSIAEAETTSFDPAINSSESIADAKPTISSFWIDEAEPLVETPSQSIIQPDLIPEFEPTAANPASPVRFAWKTNVDGQFVDISEALFSVTGFSAADIMGQSLRSLSGAIGIVDEAGVAEMFDSRVTWSGRSVQWPIANTKMVMPVEFAGLPIFTRDREFAGFRGFGIAHPARSAERPENLSSDFDIHPEADTDIETSSDTGINFGTDTGVEQNDANVVPFGRRLAPPTGTVPIASVSTTPISNLPAAVMPSLVPPIAVTPVAIPALDEQEREAFAEIGARLRDDQSPPLSAGFSLPGKTGDIIEEKPKPEIAAGVVAANPSAVLGMEPPPTTPQIDVAQPGLPQDNASIFSKLPLPVLVYSSEALHFANTAFLELSGYTSLAAIIEAGGLDRLFGDGNDNHGEANQDQTTGMHLTKSDGTDMAVSAHLQSVPWGEGKALMLAVAPRTGAAPDVDLAANKLVQTQADPQMAAAQQQIEELTAILDTATDGVVVLDASGNIRSLNNAAQALFGYDIAEIAGQPLNALLAIESHRAANEYMAGLVENGLASVLNDGRDMIGREREGRFIPVFVNIARLSSSEGFCAVVRDVTNWKRAEEQLNMARRDAESASTNKTEFLAQMSHEIRTPLNAIIGFSDVMINESFGPLGNARYKEYLIDIHRSGNLVLSLVNDLLDISKIEAGAQSFDFRAIDLNLVVEEAVALMQPQANRERVLIRTAYGYDLPQLVADERSIVQIVLNLVSNAIRFTDAGGQVIVSTSYEQNGDLTLKVRDTGIGMNEDELEDALRPYRQVGQKLDREASGTGLGLPLARALAESNKGDFKIRSTPGEGTVIEIAFPASRVLAG